MKREIAIYGAGGLGREIAGLVEDLNSQQRQWLAIGFFDDGKKKGDTVDGLPVLGGLEAINDWPTALSLVLAISDPATKEKIASAISNQLIEYPVLVHPACVSGNKATNHFGNGVVLTAGVILTTHIILGDFVLINLAATLGHDVRMGKYCSVMPGASISGAVSLGERCVIGTGARILQNISIGSDCVVGAGAVVTRSFEDGSTLIGVPAVKTR